MNYSIISFVVFLLAVHSTFSLKCYVCDKKESSYVQGECENPKPTECSEPGQNICVKLTKARRIESVYKCGSEESSYDCKDYPDNCIHCSKDLCNEPDKKTTQNSLKCYECLQDYTRPKKRPNPKTSYSFYDGCAVDNDPYSGTKTRCYPNEQCVTASSDLDLRRYQGCVKDPKHFCNQYGFDHCSFCDKDFCNKFNRVHLNRCYRCISGKHDSTKERFKNITSCKSPEEINCGRGLKCASASYTGEDFERLYRDCGPISNKTDEFCEKYNYDECELCNNYLCNIPTAKKKVTKCYYCAYGNMDVFSRLFSGEYGARLGNCSYPIIVDCEWTTSCAIMTRKKKGELVGAMHVCPINKEQQKLDCGREEIDCQFCDGNLCNKVVNYTAMNLKSSAEVLKNNTIFLVILLFILIIIRADL